VHLESIYTLCVEYLAAFGRAQLYPLLSIPARPFTPLPINQPLGSRFEMFRVKQLALVVGSALPVLCLPASQVSGEYIVTLRKDATAAQVRRHTTLISSVHAQSPAGRETSGINTIWTQSFKGYAGEFDQATLEKIKASDEVTFLLPFLPYVVL
jgi:hypothetical protein